MMVLNQREMHAVCLLQSDAHAQLESCLTKTSRLVLRRHPDDDRCPKLCAHCIACVNSVTASLRPRSAVAAASLRCTVVQSPRGSWAMILAMIIYNSQGSHPLGDFCWYSIPESDSTTIILDDTGPSLICLGQGCCHMIMSYLSSISASVNKRVDGSCMRDAFRGTSDFCHVVPGQAAL